MGRLVATDTTIFDFPVAKRTDQFDRIAVIELALVNALLDLDDQAGVTAFPLPILLLSMRGRFPVHDLPMEYHG